MSTPSMAGTDTKSLDISAGFVNSISYDLNSINIELKVLDGVTIDLDMYGRE
ncbi:hypothetical protein KQI42_07980 [Tissierella sp. MSJ-40]|uniref:Uncharacterized protein n=1 Tax=Tissierella simiarum TaxID=2841534 RepID=A0ABS6E4V1_9FIRM|nr:hypothetical protein [Tissierella simiarum]MBU5437942.1 hypothetical protein [Tissierella simiarum]